jgi:hypothetical protein
MENVWYSIHSRNLQDLSKHPGDSGLPSQLEFSSMAKHIATYQLKFKINSPTNL